MPSFNDSSKRCLFPQKDNAAKKYSENTPIRLVIILVSHMKITIDGIKTSFKIQMLEAFGLYFYEIGNLKIIAGNGDL